MRLGMPAVFPMPQEVAKCFEGKPGAYGRYVIASGPYMIEGSDDLNISSCGSMKPISGYDGQTRLNLVRNPNYNARTDSRKARESNPDRFEFTVNTNIDDIYNKIGSGRPRGLVRDRVAEGVPRVLDEREQAEVPALELRRRDVLHHHEPHAAAVRRRPRPPGDELGDGPGGSAEGMGWPGVRRRRRAHHPANS